MLNRARAAAIRILLILGILFSLPLLSAAAEKEAEVEQKEILVIGTGRIEGGNIAKAREAATGDALIRGMEVYLARRLGSQGMITNFGRLVQNVIPQAREMVENFNILAGEQTDSTYKLLVRLKVNEKLMDERFRQIGVVMAGGEAIKTLFMVSQAESPAGEISYWWEDPEGHRALTPVEVVLHRIFEGYGFVPINRLLKVPEETYTEEMKALDLSEEAAANWGRIFSALLVVYGRCEVVEGREVSIFLTALDTANGSVIDADRQVVSVETGPESSKSVMRAMEKAVNVIAARFTPAIVRATGTAEAHVTPIEITLKGLKNFKEFSAVKDFLEKEIQGVKSVKQTRVKADAMGVSVEYSGTEEEFLDKVVRHPGMPVRADVTKTEGGELIFNIR